MKPSVFKKQLKIARIFFILAALFGLYIRLSVSVDFIPITYKNVVQAHSHIAFLGWGFLATISLIGFVFYPTILQNSKKLKQLFRLMTITLVGMLISFTIQGYKLFSIVLLVVFLVVSYVYLYQVLKNLKPIETIAVKFIRTGIFYYYLSSIAVWLLPLIILKTGKSDLYHNTIYFYLHFLYNGFFVFVLFGMLFKYLENKEIKNNNKYFKTFYYLTNIACIPAYTLSLLWSNMPSVVYYVAFVAALVQLVSLVYLFKIGNALFKKLNSKFIKNLSVFVLVSYCIKIIMQFLSVFPSIMKIALQLKSYFIIGYLHLFTLGFMSLFIILLILIHPKVKLSKTGISVLIIGIFLSELFLFLQGFLITYYKGITQINTILFIVSALMPIGLLIIHFKPTISAKTLNKS